MRHALTPEVADAYGIDLATANGAQFGPMPWHKEPYAVRAPADASLLPLRSLRVRRWTEFGNSVRQLSVALSFARRHGIEVLSGPESPWFVSGAVAGVRLALGDGAPPTPALVGRFFYEGVLGMDGLVVDPSVLRDLRQLFTVDPAPADQAPDLVLHLRSGDIFGDDPHPGYWPQPLAYYQAVVEAEQPRSVVLVCMDDVHPVLAPLARWCTDAGIATRLQSASLAEDLAVLMSAPALALSVGTLGMAAAWLAPRVERVYVPHELQVQEHLRLGQQVWSADLPGSARGAWTASAEQRAGLLTDGPVRLRPLG
jgi:hypothetical protein